MSKLYCNFFSINENTVITDKRFKRLIEYLLSDAQDLLNESIENSKFKEKTDLGQTHLIKSFVDLSKWKSERIAPKYYAKRDATTLNFDKNTPLVVKWDK